MNAIVMNMLTGAVSEYSNWEFDSVAGTKAGSATGLYALGGDLDIEAPVVAEVITGKPLWGDSRKKHLQMVFFSMKGTGNGELIVQGESSEYRYPFPVRSAGQSRAKPGLGIRENYLAFGFSNPGGESFRIDRIEVLDTQSSTRRTA